jgi:hypothetical protein
MQSPYPSDENPLAHFVSVGLFGIQFPYPSDVYPDGHPIVLIVIATEIGIHPPFPSEVYPSFSSQIIGDSSVIQIPFPAYLYPLEQTGDGSGIGVLEMQFPFPSWWNPSAHVVGLEYDGGKNSVFTLKQDPYPSEVKPVMQLGELGLGTKGVVQTPLFNACPVGQGPELGKGISGEGGLKATGGGGEEQQQHPQQLSFPQPASALALAFA